MHKYLSLLILLLTISATGQNLVKNGTFAKTTGECPIISTDLDDIAGPWVSYFGSPQYFHMSCGDPGSPATTNNTQPFDGKEFVRFTLYGDTGTAYMRDYLHGELSEPLDSGKYYRVTFYVKPINTDSLGYSYAINNIGILFTDSVIDTIPDDRLLQYKPQVVETDVVDNENYWTAICGVFMAKGGEEYLTIGNFKNDAQTDVAALTNATNPRYAAYLIDFVEVYENDLPQLPADTIICDNHRIDLNISGPDVSVLWKDGSTDPNYLITTADTVWATISNLSCSYTDTILVELKNCEECKIYASNAFTPNGDGINDFWKLQFQSSIESECELLDYRIKIYDRWGKKVFESNDINISWDGNDADNYQSTNTNKLLKGGAFSYILEYRYSYLRETYSIQKRGVVSIIR